MEIDEFTETVTKIGVREFVTLEDRGVRLEFRRLSDEIFVMNMRTHDGDLLITVPFGEVEKERGGGVLLTYSGIIRAVMLDISKVVRVWGV